MSIYIPNMKPEQFYDLCKEHGLEIIAVLVPPHGDLIERKAAYDSLLDGMVMTGYQSRALDCIAEYIVPTIIPADPAEEGET